MCDILAKAPATKEKDGEERPNQVVRKILKLESITI
jgi:hypothetical protein